MTEAASEAAKSPGQVVDPKMSVLSQYVRALSFANIAASGNKTPSGKPNISVQVNVDAKSLGEDRYLIVLKVDVSAAASGDEVFKMALEYAGVFEVTNVPREMLQPVLLIECPRLLFPFARRIVAEVTRDGGYPPLMLDPIDFASLYRSHMEQAAANAEA